MHFLKTLFFCFLLYPTITFAESCTELLNNEINHSLALSYEEFDQTEMAGWRNFEDRKCFLEAEKLINAYIKKNDAKQHSLKWHLFQMQASSGKTNEAIETAKLCLISSEVQKNLPLLWNDYVNANIAFLNGDKKLLEHYKILLEKGASNLAGNKANLDIVVRMLNNIGKKNFKQIYYGE